nr:MAG TPA: hypothetical protein [Caudoviricetes sp.]
MCYYSNVMFQQKVLFKSELIVYIFLRKCHLYGAFLFLEVK